MCLHPVWWEHDWHRNLRTKQCQPIPRHREIMEFLARNVLKKLSDWASARSFTAAS